MKYFKPSFSQIFSPLLYFVFFHLLLFLSPSGSVYGQTRGPVDGATSVTTKGAPGTARIWIVTGAHVEQKDMAPIWRGIRVDGGNMLMEGAPWETVSRHTQVVKFPPANIERAKDPALQRAFRDLDRRHIAMALEASLLIRSSHCAETTEAYGRPGSLEWLLKKIQRNGGDLQYIAMDEPFFYGNSFSGPNACHDSATEIAREIAENLKMVRTIFPKVKVGDIEVLGDSKSWTDELIKWVDTYRSVVGEPLAFLHVDISWSKPAIRNLAPLAERLKQRKVPFGIIYNADLPPGTDKEWTEKAIQNFIEIESVLGVHPDDAIFQTWVPQPSHMLPENRPGAFMNVPFQYLHAASTLTLTRQGNILTGRLTDASDRPLPHAGVLIDALDVGGRMGLTDRSLTDVVPGGAKSAVIGIRANLEGSRATDELAGAAVGGIQYRELGTGRQEVVSPVTLPITGAPPSIRTLKLTPDTTYLWNLKQFAVTAGKTFTLKAPIMATGNAEHAGYATIVFLDSAGKGFTRRNLWFTPSKLRLDSVITDEDGRFRLQLSNRVLDAQEEIRAFYEGNQDLRQSMASLSLSSAREDAMMPALVPFRPLPSSPKEGSPLVYLYPLTDFTQLFNSDATWQAGERKWEGAGRHVQVMAFSTQYLTKVSDSILSNIVKMLKSRNIGLGIESLATNWYHEPPCGMGIEGYCDPGTTNAIVAKLLRVGGTPAYIGMDEPLWFGHFYDGKNACRSSLQDLAGRVAVNIRIYKAAFPNVVIGDIEPFPAVSNQPNWQADLAVWVKAFHNATGTPLSFLRLDVNWDDPVLSMGPSHNTPSPAAITSLVRKAASAARQNGLQVAVIYNGGIGNTDALWMQEARDHIRIVEASGIRPEQVIFQSWDKFPARSLPDTDPNALASLINYYFEHY